MDTRIFLASVLHCGVLDVDFLMRLMDEAGACVYDLRDDIEIYRTNHITVHDFIYRLLDQIANDFLQKVVKSRAVHFNSTNYQIFINFLDSHVWFEDENLNRWFEHWRWR